jgi:hypothetical protein
LAVNTAGNLASTSPIERRVLGAVTTVAAGLAVVVARSPVPMSGTVGPTSG